MQLIPIENVNAIELFKDSASLELLLAELKKTATDFEPDTSTPDGRKEIASQAYKVSQSKTVMEKAGKALTEDWTRQKKVVDIGRRRVREFCDQLRDEIRQPLTEYEAQEKIEAEAAALKAKIEADEIAAHSENDLIDREAKMLAFEAKQEAERIEAERIEAEKVETEAREKREEQIRKDAERDAAEAIEREKKAREDAEKRVKEQAEQAERDRIEAAERAEREKLEAIEREKQNARELAERKERERLQMIEDNERELQARAANIENRQNINGQIVAALVKGGVSNTAARKVVSLVVKGDVPAMSIRY
jgi:hypothetical protein